MNCEKEEIYNSGCEALNFIDFAINEINGIKKFCEIKDMLGDVKSYINEIIDPLEEDIIEIEKEARDEMEREFFKNRL